MHRCLPVLLLAAIVLTACGTTSTRPPTSSARPTTTRPVRPAPIVGWARQFCGLDSQLSTSLPSPPLAPPAGQATDADRQTLLDYLQQAKSLLTNAQQAFAALSPAPTADATAMLAGYRKNIDEALNNVTGDISSTAGASLSDVELDFTLDPAALALLQSASLDTVSTAVKAHPDLKLAFTGVPGCSVYTTGG